MIDKAKNKSMEGKDNKQNKSEFFFAGGLEHEPMTIVAENAVEAEEQWKKARIKINK